jgi:hypothetical protein
MLIRKRLVHITLDIYGFFSYPSDSELLAPGGIFRPEVSVRHCHDLSCWNRVYTTF